MLDSILSFTDARGTYCLYWMGDDFARRWTAVDMMAHTNVVFGQPVTKKNSLGYKAW